MYGFFHQIVNGDKHHHPLDRIAEINSIISGVALFPQLFKIISTGSIVGFSILTFSIIAANSLVWLAYALHRRLKPLLISAILNFVAASGIVFCIIFF